MNHDERPPDDLAARARREARALLDCVLGVTTVVIATPDGFDIAHARRGVIDAARIAAMGSSISAIGDVVSQEAALGFGSSVTIETASGYVVVRRILRQDRELVVCVVTDPSAILAQVAYGTARLASHLTLA